MTCIWACGTEAVQVCVVCSGGPTRTRSWDQRIMSSAALLLKQINNLARQNTPNQAKIRNLDATQDQ
jgi:hypothetical protein